MYLPDAILSCACHPDQRFLLSVAEIDEDETANSVPPDIEAQVTIFLIIKK